jgi:uncharacterized membrane protein YiaA
MIMAVVKIIMFLGAITMMYIFNDNGESSYFIGKISFNRKIYLMVIMIVITVPITIGFVIGLDELTSLSIKFILIAQYGLVLVIDLLIILFGIDYNEELPTMKEMLFACAFMVSIELVMRYYEKQWA